ncbi:MAG: hypothetical protein JWM57_1684 [Phycisphaerales bacterium]|nr:hypothetical protein [Phycisphaerales bacterium]
MPTDKNALRAGLFIVVAIALAAGVLLAIQGSRNWLEPKHTITAAFDLTENLGGLKVGDPVRVGGFDQGSVAAIRFVSGQPPHVEVEFSLPTKYELRTDANVGVEQGLTGAANLNIVDFGKGDAWKDGTILDGRPSALTTFYALAPEITGLVAAVRSKVGPAYDRYDTTLTNADGAVIEAKKAMVAFSDFLGGSGPDLRGTLANMNKATDTLNTRLPKTLDKADSFIDETKQTVMDARHTFSDAKAALVSARDTINDAHNIITRNRSRIDNILTSVRETANNLEGASAEVRRSPWRLLYKPSADEVNNLQLYDTTRQFARAASQLNDAAGAVRDAAADPDVDRKQLQSLLTDLQATFGKYQKVEQTFWQGVK